MYNCTIFGDLLKAIKLVIILFHQYSFYTIVFKPKFNHILIEFCGIYNNTMIKIDYYLKPRFLILFVNNNIGLLSLSPYIYIFYNRHIIN